MLPSTSTNPTTSESNQKRAGVIQRLGLGAFTISLIVHGVFIILAIFFLYKWIAPPVEKIDQFVPGGGGGGNGGAEASHKIQKQMKSRMAPPSVAKKISSTSTTAAFALPESNTEMMDSGVPMDVGAASAGSGGGAGGGHGTGIGTGIGSGSGPGSGPGSGRGFLSTSPFGSKENGGSAMVGSFYDFKQDENGKPVKYDIGNPEDFDSRVKKVQRGNFREAVFRNFFKAPTPLYLSQVAIPDGRAEQGPTVFNVADKVKPSGWVVHYTARLVAPRDINFRFVGVADDYLCAMVDGRPRMVAVWGHAADDYYGWKPEPPSGEHPGPFRSHALTYGDWIRLRKGQEFEMDIAIGERPGGFMTFLLMIEEKDVTYKMSGARPILPLFSTEAIRPERKAQIVSGFGGYEFAWDNVPVFAPVQKKNNFGL